MTEEELKEKERLIKADIKSIENRVRHAFNQGYEMGSRKEKAIADQAENEISVLFGKMISEIEQSCSWYCFDDWGNYTPEWDSIKSVIDKYTGGNPE